MRKLLSNKILLVLLLLFFSYNIKAKNNILKDTTIIKNDTSTYIFPKNSLYLELLGTAQFYSVNFEKIIFYRKNNALSFRIGFSFLTPPYENLFMYPVIVNYHTFINKRLIFDLGTGIVYWHLINNKELKNIYTDNCFVTLKIGATYLFKNNGFVKFSFTPTIDEDNQYLYSNFWFGASIGFKFGKQ